METAVIIGIALGIIWQGYELTKRQIQLGKEMNALKRRNNDMNIEFGSMHESGIELIKKQYPELNIEDDHRESVTIQEPHSIAAGMNDPSQTQKKAFNEENK